MNINQYFGIGSYNGLGYYKGIVSAQLPERPDYGEEVRDNEYYAEKYYHRFRSIVSMIERGELKFDNKREENEAWRAACDAMCRYRSRAERFSFIKEHGRDMTDDEYLYKHGYSRSA